MQPQFAAAYVVATLLPYAEAKCVIMGLLGTSLLLAAQAVAR